MILINYCDAALRGLDEFAKVSEIFIWQLIIPSIDSHS